MACIPGVLGIDNVRRRDGNFCLTNDLKEESIRIKWDEGCITETREIIELLDHYAVRWITIRGKVVKKNPRTVAWDEVLKITIQDAKAKAEYIEEEKRADARSRTYQEDLDKLNRPVRTPTRSGPRVEVKGKREQIEIKKPTIVRSAAKPIVIEKKKDLEEKVRRTEYVYDEEKVKLLGEMSLRIAEIIEEKIEDKYGKEPEETEYFEDDDDPPMEVPVVFDWRKIGECLDYYKQKEKEILEEEERRF
jgi:hypothetical protein